MTQFIDFPTPTELRTRGTVIVVPGRGESPASYSRFGRRLAVDAYRVRVVPPPRLDQDPLPRFAADLATAVTTVDDGFAGPLVLVGTDAGAAAVAALVAGGDQGASWWPQGVVLAGLPAYGGHPAADWDDELDARTHCPVHRGVLGEDPAARPGSFAAPVPPALLDAAYQSTAEVAHLLLLGDCDPIADLDLLRGLAKSLPTARLSTVLGAHHDVLNDLQHRSVAAEIVAFLEALRAGPPLETVVRVEASAW